MEKSLGTFCDKCLGDNLIGHNMGGVEEEKKRVCHRMRSNLFRHSVTQGVGWSHAISDSVAWSRDGGSGAYYGSCDGSGDRQPNIIHGSQGGVHHPVSR